MESKKRLLIQRTLAIILVCFVSAVAINVFITPHKLLSGGLSGISLTIQYFTKISAGYFILILNIPLLIISLKETDMEFTYLSLIGTVSQSVFLILTKDFSQYCYVKDIMLSCIYGGAIHGIALGLIFSNHGSLAGFDIISILMRRKYNLDIGMVSFGINLVIVSVGAVFFGIETGMYTLISIYISSFIMDKVIKGFDRKKLLFIITDKEELVTEKIKDELKRSSTLLYGEGSYSKEKKNVIYCVVSLVQVPKAKRIVESVDRYAFISILDTSEVVGKGFKRSI